MQWFQKLRVTVKLILSFLVVAALGAAVSAFGIFYMGRINASTDRLYTHEFRTLQAVQDANINLVYASRAQMGLLSASTRGERNDGSNRAQGFGGCTRSPRRGGQGLLPRDAPKARSSTRNMKP